jgi:hypothetical protein
MIVSVASVAAVGPARLSFFSASNQDGVSFVKNRDTHAL